MTGVKDCRLPSSTMTRSGSSTVDGAPGPDALLSVIVLAYNDAPSLLPLLREIDSLAAVESRPLEIIVVDDGSTDNTSESVARAGVRNASVRVVRHTTNRGVGAGFATGIAAATGEIISYMDGDGQYVPADLPRLVAELRRVDVACGVRTRRADPLPRLLISAAYRTLLRLLFGLDTRDPNCGIKAFRRSYLASTGPPRSRGPFFDAELLALGLGSGHTIAEVPVRHRPRAHGRALGVSLLSIRLTLEEAGGPLGIGLLRQGLAPRILQVGVRASARLLRVLDNGASLARRPVSSRRQAETARRNLPRPDQPSPHEQPSGERA